MKKEGERHHKEYLRLLGLSDKQLLSSIKSYRKNADEHRQKILNPHEQYCGRWDKMLDQHKTRVIKKWRMEAEVFEEQHKIAESIAKERGLTWTSS